MLADTLRETLQRLENAADAAHRPRPALVAVSKRQTAAAVAEQDVAYAASGADLSFGTPQVARSQAFREGDYAANTNAMTTGNTIDHLELRRKNYLRMAGQARSMGMFEGLVGGLTGFSKMFPAA